MSANAPSSTDVAASGEYLSFKLGAEEYGIPILSVQEIRGYAEPTHIANAPAFIKGVVNLRGVIVPIVDLRIKFAQKEVAYNDITVTIVLNIGSRVLGIVVDSVSDVTALKGDQIKPAPDFQASIDASFITGIATVEQGEVQRMLILMDIEKLLGSTGIGLIDQVAHV